MSGRGRRKRFGWLTCPSRRPWRWPDVAGSVEDGLLTLASATTLVVMAQTTEAELTAGIAEKRRSAERVGTGTGPPRARWCAGVQGPNRASRGRTTVGTEIELDTWKVCSAPEDLLRQHVVEPLLARVATRRTQSWPSPSV